MKQNLINDVMQSMLSYLNNAQLEKLQAVMQYILFQYEITKKDENTEDTTLNLVDLFLSAKRVEGCSEKSLKYYHTTIQAMLSTVNKDIKQERCFCVSKNSPSANVHGCTFADRVSTPSLFKRLTKT